GEGWLATATDHPAPPGYPGCPEPLLPLTSKLLRSAIRRWKPRAKCSFTVCKLRFRARFPPCLAFARNALTPTGCTRGNGLEKPWRKCPLTVGKLRFRARLPPCPPTARDAVPPAASARGSRAGRLGGRCQETGGG